MVGRQTHCAGVEALASVAGESLDSAQDVDVGVDDESAEWQEAAEHEPAALFRAGDAESDVAERHLHLQAGGALCAPDCVHGRLLALHPVGGALSFSDWVGGAGGLPSWGRGVQPPEGDADGSGPAVCELAWEEPFCGGDGEGEDPPHQESCGTSADAGEGGAVLVEHLAGVFGAGAVRELRVGAGAHQTLGRVLQPQAAASGDRGAVSGRPLLRDRPRAAQDDRGRDQGERAGTGVAGRAAGAVLHGGTDGGAVGGAAGGERQIKADGGGSSAKPNQRARL